VCVCYEKILRVHRPRRIDSIAPVDISMCRRYTYYLYYWQNQPLSYYGIILGTHDDARLLSYDNIITPSHSLSSDVSIYYTGNRRREFDRFVSILEIPELYYNMRICEIY
jgi:hypothetical protein